MLYSLKMQRIYALRRSYLVSYSTSLKVTKVIVHERLTYSSSLTKDTSWREVGVSNLLCSLNKKVIRQTVLSFLQCFPVCCFSSPVRLSLTYLLTTHPPFQILDSIGTEKLINKQRNEKVNTYKMGDSLHVRECQAEKAIFLSKTLSCPGFTPLLDLHTF